MRLKSAKMPISRNFAGKTTGNRAKNQHPSIKSVRRSGLLFAIEFSSFEENKHIIDRCLEKGVFTDWFLFAPHCLRIAPSLLISNEEIETACRKICEIL